MRFKSFLMTLLLLLQGALSLSAQENTLSVQDVAVVPGGTMDLPVNLDNTDDVVALQFVMSVPQVLSLSSETAALSARAADHVVTMQEVDAQKYLVMIYSPTNQTIKDHTGQLMRVRLNASAGVTRGSQYAVTLSDVVITTRAGHNVATQSRPGNVTVARAPDLAVADVSVSSINTSSINPGDTLSVGWTVQNVGDSPTCDGWSEQIMLVSKDGKVSRTVATIHFDGTLDAGGVVSRHTEVALPLLLGIDGETDVQVRVVPYPETGEPPLDLANNLQSWGGTLAVSKHLVLELSPRQVDEGDAGRVALRVSRTGQWQTVETFSVSASADSRVRIPASITIPASQSGALLYFDVDDNDDNDADSQLQIQVDGCGYPQATTTLVIVDDELASLALSASKTDIDEGETFQLTVSTGGRVSAAPVSLVLSCEKTHRFNFPSEVTLPAGEQSVTVDVTAVDNDEIEQQESIAFWLTAEGYERAECLVSLADNDMPSFSFTLSPEYVSEADGYAALFGVIKRTDNLDKRVTFRLSDDSNGLLTYTHQTITMEKNKADVQFTIGVEDNKVVDGNHVVNVTAEVYASSCDCMVQGVGQGALTAAATVIDDDGPTVTIKPAGTSMLEGSEGNVFTVSHNVQSPTDVKVYISSDKDDMLEYDHELIIPAGKTSAELVVNVQYNDVQDDDNIVAFKAEAEGYAMGTCWLLITDQTLPDAIVSLYADKDEVLAEGTVMLRAVVKNVGNGPLRSSTSVDISFSGRKETVKLPIGSSVAAGDSIAIEYNYEIPAITGKHTFEATVNKSCVVPELIYGNNDSRPVAISVLSPYSLTAQADKDFYGQTDNVCITGTAQGEAGKNAQIDVYLINDDARLTIPATTDAKGNYTVNWTPLSRSSGHFIVGACYPGGDDCEEMDAFDVYGVKVGESYETCELATNESSTGKITITNPGLFDQSGLTVKTKVESATCDFAFSLPSTIGAGQSVDIEYTLTGKAASEGHDWQQMPLEITTTEGASSDFTLYYFVHPQKAKLEANQSYINTTMTLGTPREYPVTITNIGRGETGKITLALPKCIETATPREMASLAHGESADIVLRFVPTEEMQLNMGVDGRIGINCANGDGTYITFHLTPVSQTKGTLKVDVADEYTYFTEEAPHVYGAKVTVTNPSTREVVAEGETALNGLFVTEVPEGNYTITVDADKHNSYTNTVLVDPGVEKYEEVFLSYQAITYSWEVVETGIEDAYEIETVVKFETRVPKPVVVVTLPEERPEPNSIIPIVVTNHGLVNALDFDLDVGVNEGYTIEFLNATSLDVIAPQQTHIIYAKLKPTDDSSEGAHAPRKVPSNWECFSFETWGTYKDPCDKNPDKEKLYLARKWGYCERIRNGGSGGNERGPGSPSIWDNDRYSWDYTFDAPRRFCDKGAHKVDDYGPIGRKVVPDDPIKKTDCDEYPVLVYKLVPTEGTRYEMLGVAADGVSQVKLVLDPSASSVPSPDCKNVYGFGWVLSKPGFGKIEQISDWEAIYTAPDHFPEANNDSITTVEAKFSYRRRPTDMPEEYIGWLEYGPSVTIEIIRPPVVFIHGLGSSAKCWKDADNYLTDRGYYKKNINTRVDYEKTNTRGFAENIGVVADGIYLSQRNALVHGYIATKCDLIGHSMGGLLARLFVERGGRKEDVNRIITVNTPHSGSEIGDIVMAHPIVVKNAARVFYNNVNFDKYWTENLDAIRDLAVESEETAKLVNVAGHFNIPVYALGTESDAYDNIMLGGNVCMGVVNLVLLAGALADPEPITKVILCAFGLLANESDHYLNDDYAQLGEGDLVVSSESQTGGCRASKIIRHGPWHSGSTSDARVISEISKLLLTPPSDPTFSTEWFAPKNRDFEHNTFWLWAGRAANVIPLAKIGKEGTIKVFSKAIEVKDGFVSDAIGVISAAASTVKSWCNVFKKPKSKPGGGSSWAPYAGNDDRTICMELNLPKELSFVTASVFLDDQLAYLLSEDEREYTVPSTFAGEVMVRGLLRDEDGDLYTIEFSLEYDAPLATPVSIEAEELTLIVGEDNKVSLPCTWDDGSQTYVTPTEVTFDDASVARYADGSIQGLKTGMTQCEMTYAGLSCNTVVRVFPPQAPAADEDDSESVCTTVTLSFKQQNVMTRQAFRGTFTVNNGNEMAAMTDVKMNLEVRDEYGILATKREFQIDPESLSGFEGALDFDSGWTLGAGAKGSVDILFIPTKYAAPIEPKNYSFGGSFSYTDPYTGMTITRTLNPVTLTVKPSPNLELMYFMQRDVFGDDPLTEEVEPKVPAEFALLVNNKGYGAAENMNLTMHQPAITANEKGLAVNFQIISAQLNGQPANASMGGSMTSDFGTIPAQSQAYAQWWLESSLLGHFIDYDVKATHVTSRNNPDLSLLDTVSIHELIHGFTVTAADGKPMRGFLVNDIKDHDDQPDAVYFTDATQEPAYIAKGASMAKRSDFEYTLLPNAGSSGWYYGSLPDPTDGRQKLAKVLRADGTEVPADNFWQTDRTLRDGKDPLYENRLHFVSNMATGSEAFYLTFEPCPDVELEVESYDELPPEGTILKEQLKAVTVKFNKPIKAETFTTDDLTLTCQGKAQDVAQIAIERLSNTEYRLVLDDATMFDGYYVLTVQTAGIEDTEGFNGVKGKQAIWIQFVDGQAVLKVTASPAEGGTVTPASGRFDCGTDVKLKVTPADGYYFAGWTRDGYLLSTDKTLTYNLTEDTELKALFDIKHLYLNISYDSAQGVVKGASGGIYDYGTQLQLTATPAEGYEFDCWIVNDEYITSESSCTLTLTQDMDVYGAFKINDIPTDISSACADPLRVAIAPLPLRDYMHISGNFTEIHSMMLYDLSGSKVIAETHLKPGQDIYVGKLSPGIYFLRLSTDKGAYSAKLLKR